MSARHRVLRVGRLGPRHRRWSYAILGACAATGTVWFALMDVASWEAPRLTTWWILHALSGLAALGVLGAVLPAHVPLAWTHHRNRWLGGLTLAVLAVAVLSAAALMYGKEAWHDLAHWLHVGIGLAGIAVFVAHAVFGRRSVGRRAGSAGASGSHR